MDSFRRYLIRTLQPISKFLGHIYLAPKSRQIRFNDITAIYSVAKIGDVILSFSKGELTNFFIDGEYKHCGIYDGDGHVIEAIGKGVQETPLPDFCANKDKIAILRPMFSGNVEAIIAVTIASAEVGKPYDYLFEPNERAFYCAELVAYCYNKAMGGDSPFVPRTIMGVETVLPVDFKLADKKFKLVMERPLNV